MESQKNSSFIGRGSCAGKLLRIPGIHHYWQLADRIRSWRQRPRGRSLLLRLSFHLLLRTQLRFFIRISWSEKEILSWRLRMSFTPGLEGFWVLNNATGFRKIYIVAGYTDLRRGIDGLVSIVKFKFQLDSYEKDILFLFCGRRSDCIKGDGTWRIPSLIKEELLFEKISSIPYI